MRLWAVLDLTPLSLPIRPKPPKTDPDQMFLL